MKKQLSRVGIALLVIVSPLMMLALSPSAEASTAYGSLNNFDCVNDTGVEAHGFEIELDDVHSKDITYTYDYNHYGIPKITEDNADPAHPKVFIRYAATRNPDGTWTAFTAIPSGPITPTDGHQFTNPSVNFGGEHFGVGYYGAPTAVKYNWLIDDGTGNLVHGPPVYVSTPTFTYYPPAPLQPAQVQAVIVPPPPPAPPVLQFGEATWVKDIKTTTHNPNKVELTDLVDPDPENPAAHNWANGEPAEVETEWRILQTEFANADNPKGKLAGAPQGLPGGDEVITRRYEFYKYIGPIDAESGEAMADQVGPDGIHGVGSVTYNDHIDPVTGEWVQVTVDLSTVEVVGDFFGAQMSGFDVAPVLGLIDHIPDGELGVAYANRTVVVAGGAAFLATTSGSLPDGTTLDVVTGIFSGTPLSAGVFTFTVEASDTSGAVVSKTYIVTIPDGVPVTSTIATSASPVAGGSTTGDGVYNNGTPVTVVATHNAGYAFVNWTEGGVEVSASAVYPFTVTADRTLVANFILGGCTTDADCTDADACTTDTCVNGVCQHQPIAGCCLSDGDCDDGNTCTGDKCLAGICDHPNLPNGTSCDDSDACTSDDKCVGGNCVGTPDPSPFIVHGLGGPGETSPCTGYIDPRIENLDPDLVPKLGVGVTRPVRLVFSEPVFAIGGGPVGPGSFTVMETPGAGAGPAVTAVNRVSATTFELTLARIPKFQQWTTIIANVEDACGNVILSNGDQGPGAEEPDRLDFGFLPGNINQDGLVSPTDLINLRQRIAGNYTSPCAELLYFDIDRDGAFPLPTDLIKFRQILGGAPPATRVWGTAPASTMNSTQP